MIAVVVPEPAPWPGPVLAAVRASVARMAAAPAADPGAEPAMYPDRVQVLAPWAVAGPMPAWAPARLRAFRARRAQATAALVGMRITPVPGWQLGESALRAWAGARTDRTLAARFAVRALVDHMAARWVERMGPEVTAVVAPSCAAWRTFAAAARRGIPTFLVEDLPGIRALHADLDAAALVHPQCAFLRRYRAGRGAMVRQEAERVLADHVMVRGRHARAQHEHAGRPPGRIIDLVLDLVLPEPAASGHPPAGRSGRADGARVLLAGLAAARHGTVEALAAIDARPHITLLIRAGEGLEPAALRAHPRVAVGTEAERRHLHGVDVVIAPSWCEAYLPEVAQAAARGVPVIATGRGAGFVTPAVEIAPGDVGALGAALDRVLAG